MSPEEHAGRASPWRGSGEGGRVWAGVGTGEHGPREQLHELAAEPPGAWLVPEIGGLVGILLQIVELAPLHAVVDADPMAGRDQAAHAHAARESQVDALAFLLDHELVAGGGLAGHER